jgi:hypothetical protein
MKRAAQLGLLLVIAASAVLAKEKKEEPVSILPFLQDDAGMVYFETEHEVAGATGDELFTRAEQWVTASFAEHQIEKRVADSKRAWIKFVTPIPTPQGWHGVDGSGDGFLRFEIQLAFKDARAKFRATDFHFLVNHRFGGDGKMRVDVADDELFAKSGKKPEKAREELVATLTALSDSLGKALATGGGPDW